MVNIKLDASPGKRKVKIPKDKEGRKAYYLDLMEKYQAANPVKFESKKAELLKKAEGWEYIAGRWVNVFAGDFVEEEVKLTASQKEQLELERINALNQEKDAKIADLEARLGALESKPKGRPKKTK